MNGKNSLEFKILEGLKPEVGLIELTIPNFKFKDSDKTRLNKIRIQNLSNKQSTLQSNLNPSTLPSSYQHPPP